MAIRLDDLGRDCSRTQSEFLTNFALNSRIEMGVCADCAAQVPDANAFPPLCGPFFSAPEPVVHHRHLQAEGDRLRVNAVTASDHRRLFVSARLSSDDL